MTTRCDVAGVSNDPGLFMWLGMAQSSKPRTKHYFALKSPAWLSLIALV